MGKLHSIALAEVRFERVTLAEVVKHLSAEARRLDPSGEGINFMIASANPNPAEGAKPQATTDLPLADLGETIIELNPPLLNLKLIEVLRAITMAADQRIKFTVEEFGVVFSPKPPEKEPLETRTFRVNPNTFYQGLQGIFTNLPARNAPSTNAVNELAPGKAPATPGGGIRLPTTTNDMSVVNIAVRDYFEAAGVELIAPQDDLLQQPHRPADGEGDAG